MKKLIAVLLALSCMLIGAAAVAETLNVAYMPNYGSLWAVETAINKGYFEEEGLTLNLVEFADGPTIIAAMESGSIDVGYIGQGAQSCASMAALPSSRSATSPTATRSSAARALRPSKT